jgi:sugar/nucleoside kinase (ribokinase family)
VATITVAGPEPEAVGALAELATLGPSNFTSVASSIRFAIHDEGRSRRLVLEALGADLAATPAEVAALAPQSVLVAPIAGELSASTLRACATAPMRVAALQGWLRHLVPGEAATAEPLAVLGYELSDALGKLDALVASHEDLAAVAGEPRAQLEALRAHVGSRPLLVVTAGPDGAWLDDPATAVRHLPATRRLEEISTIGAGDAFAALLAVAMGDRLAPLDAVAGAMDATAAFLAARR